MAISMLVRRALVGRWGSHAFCGGARDHRGPGFLKGGSPQRQQHERRTNAVQALDQEPPTGHAIPNRQASEARRARSHRDVHVASARSLTGRTGRA